MIRPAKFADIPALSSLIEEAYARSKYLGRGAVDVKEAKALLMRAVQHAGAPGVGGSLVVVAEGEGGQIAGFMIGLLERCYHVGDKLMASDLYLYVAPGAPWFAWLRLLLAYDAWASANPKVIQIGLSATDAVGDYRRVERLFRRIGFRQSGVLYERAVA